MADIVNARAPAHVAGRPWAEAVLGALADPDPAVRRLCPADVVPDVSALVAGDPDPEIRIKAVKVLGNLVPGETGARSAVVAAATGDPDPAVRRAASLVAAGQHPPSHQRLRRQARSRRSKAAARAEAQVRDGGGGC